MWVLAGTTLGDLDRIICKKGDGGHLKDERYCGHVGPTKEDAVVANTDGHTSVRHTPNKGEFNSCMPRH